MYEDALGTDWESIDREEALHRAYALGVADVLGGAPEGELERIREALSGRYDRSMVDLAYEEGVAEAEGRRPAEGESTAWADLVEDEETTVTERVAPPRGPKQTDRPSVVDLPGLVSQDRDELGRLDLPEFLR